MFLFFHCEKYSISVSDFSIEFSKTRIIGVKLMSTFKSHANCHVTRKAVPLYASKSPYIFRY